MSLRLGCLGSKYLEHLVEMGLISFLFLILLQYYYCYAVHM